MKMLSISAWDGERYISLAELILLIGSEFINAKWYVDVVDAGLEPGGEELEGLDPNVSIDIFELLRYVAPSLQIVDGKVTAKFQSDGPECLVLQAVDSTTWDIWTSSNKVISIIINAYP
jgi:hypothetical protein